MILGKHTIDETRQFAKLIDFRVDAEDKLIASKKPLPQDDATLAALARYAAWRENWKKVRDAQIQAINLASAASNVAIGLVPESSLPSEAQYKKLQCAVNKSCDDSHTDPTDMANVMLGVEKALGQRADLSDFRRQFPEAPTSFDPDLLIFQGADASTQALEQAARDAAAGAKVVASTMPWWMWVGGVAAVGAVGYVYVAPLLPRRRG